MVRVAILVAVLGGCTMRNFNRATLTVSQLTIACDYGQTLDVARTGWSNPNLTEWNPILGVAPSPLKLTAYNASAMIANLALYTQMPERWAWLVPLIVGVVQLQVITANAIVAPKPFCGL